MEAATSGRKGSTRRKGGDKSGDSAAKGEKSAKRSKRSAAGVSPGDDDTVEDDVEFLSRPDVKLTLPEELKQRLVEDWDQITKQQKVSGDQKSCQLNDHGFLLTYGRLYTVTAHQAASTADRCSDCRRICGAGSQQTEN